jgi:hypothetical protein
MSMSFARIAIAVVAAALLSVRCSGPLPEQTSGQPHADREPATQLLVTLYGIGPVRAGMSVAEASSALGVMLGFPKGVATASCTYLSWPGGPDGVSLMVEDFRIARVDVRSGATTTVEAARIGDSADRIRQLYMGRVTSSPHKYTEGQYLTVAPPAGAPSDTDFRLIFEIEDGRVTRYRSGKVPQVGYVEGCS